MDGKVGHDMPTTSSGGGSGSGADIGAGGVLGQGGVTSTGGVRSEGGTGGGGIGATGGTSSTGGSIAGTGGAVGSGGNGGTLATSTTPTIDCGHATTLANGSVTASSTTVGSEASYACDPGYNLSGSSKRLCQTDATWSGKDPTCVPVDCGALVAPANGSVMTPSTTFLGTASYACSKGYVLSGAAKRTCQANGTWSGTASHRHRRHKCILGIRCHGRKGDAEVRGERPVLLGHQWGRAIGRRRCSLDRHLGQIDPSASFGSNLERNGCRQDS
jgi:hypothetical protein